MNHLKQIKKTLLLLLLIFISILELNAAIAQHKKVLPVKQQEYFDVLIIGAHPSEDYWNRDWWKNPLPGEPPLRLTFISNYDLNGTDYRGGVNEYNYSDRIRFWHTDFNLKDFYDFVDSTDIKFDRIINDRNVCIFYRR